jgi:hypothetical protein
MIVEAVVLAGLGLAAYLGRTRIANAFKSDVQIAVSRGSAFARVAEQEGKLIALKAAAAVKKAEALAAHASLDEIDSLLG